ncbi:Signal transduction histidine kinase (modular protein) [uncultured Alphaproteobacteria bacterium]|uniref:histidine kinase n=1 Tax=uncultured Alphaproteobacteria bacterium TaxID=91750 RepID=A0A212KMV2_9PROT|nr:Signal transduction histidine kinase (modular protein) [uncultured Alphaproteobacteria bacterium]
MRFRDWPIGLKLLIAPGLVMAGAVAAMLVAWVTLSELQEAAAQRAQDRQVRDVRAATLRVSLIKSDLALFRALAWRTIGVRDEVAAGLRAGAEARLDSVEILAEMFDAEASADEAVLAGATRAEARRYVATARAALGAAGAAAMPQVDEVERRFADAETALREWEAFYLADRQAHDANAAAAERRVVMIALGGAAAAFAVSVALSLLLSGAISRAVRRATLALSRLAAGETGVEIIASDRADEVGRLLHAAAVFKRNARAFERAVGEQAEAEAQARAALQEQFDRLAGSEQRLRDIAGAASDWFWETDAEDRLVMISDRFFEVSGFSPAQVIGVTRLSFAQRAETPEEVATWVNYAKNIAMRRPFRNLDYCIKATDGRLVHVRSNGVPVFVKGEFIGYRGASSDVTALVDAQREALQSSRLASVGQLAAGIAHEINTPIQYLGDNLRFFESSIKTIAAALDRVRTAAAVSDEVSARIEQTLDEADVPYLLEELPTAARQSLDGVEHVARIVRSMKEFSHPGSTAKVMTDINRALESTLTVTTNEWKHTAKVEKDFDPDLPKILCLPADLNQVLLNLVVNASQALEGRETPGLIRIGTRRDGDAVEIRIADNGPGVPDGLRERIFDPFFTTKAVGKGTGQGLAIAMDVVVKKHGGRLTLEETPGGGATFVVRLPIAAEAGEDADETLDPVRR